MKTALFVQKKYFADRVNGITYETHCAPYRVKMITAFTSTQVMPGGWDTASFTIPKAFIRYDAQAFGEDTLCFVKDGMETVFHGVVVSIVPQPGGDYAVTLDGSYRLLGRTFMREIWMDNDLTKWKQVSGGAKNSQFQQMSNGGLEFSFTKGSSYNNGDHVSADYFLFGEIADTRDRKTMNGWWVQFASGGNYDANNNLEFRIYGRSSVNDTNQDLLQTFQSSTAGRYETANTNQGQNNTAWPSSTGYRCFRIGLYANADTGSLTTDRTARIEGFKVSTRATQISLNPNATLTIDRVISDLFRQANKTFDTHMLLAEESSSATGISVVQDVRATAQADNLAYPDWTTPQQIIQDLVGIDNVRCGMWGPSHDAGFGSSQALSPGASDNVWYRQPPGLVYEEWSDVNSHDYVVRLSAGAEWVPSSDPTSLSTMVYASYTNLNGNTVTDVQDDASTENRLWEQGKHRATEWSIDPASGAVTADSLGKQYLKTHRQPALVGTLTLFGDRPGCVELPGGGRVTKLSAFKCGLVRVVDAPGAKTGRVESVTYTAKAPGQRETLVLVLNDPRSAKLQQRLNRISYKEAHRRNK